MDKTKSENKLKIIIADDHPIFREGLINIIKKDSSFEILYETGNGRDAFEAIKKNNPDVAILDISMPDMTGLEAAKKLFEENINTKIIILTLYSEEEYFNEAIAANAKGYILKESISNELIEAIKKVNENNYYISPQISNYLLNRNVKEKNNSNTSLEKLTPSEKQILKLITENKTSKQIADELFISIRTVQNHRNNICRKLELEGHNKLLLFGIENKAHL